MDDIARHLSVSKKTLYQHFTDKEEIVTQVCQTHLDRSTDQMNGIREDAENAIDELAKISVCVKQNMSDTNPSLLFDLQKYHPKAWAVWMEHKHKRIYESVVRNLKQGIEDGHYRTEINTEIIAVSRMTSKGFGDSKTVGTNNTEVGRAKNRRTEFLVTSVD